MVNEGASPLGRGAVVLVLSESQNSARLIESHLRNAGHPLRAAWLTDLEDLEDALRRAAPDLVLCEPRLAGAPLADVTATCNRLAPDVPLLMLSDDTSTQQALAALRAGARDCVSCSDEASLAHLERVCLRELSVHEQVQDIRRLRMQLAEFERRHSNLVAGTADAIARVHEGIIAEANPAFAALTGHDSAGELEGIPLMDLVAENGRTQVKSKLRQLLKGKIEQDLVELPLRHRDGSQRLLSAHMTRSQPGGETQIQLVIRSEPVRAQASGLDRQARPALFEALTAAAVPGARPMALLALRVDEAERLEERLGLADADEVFATLKELIAGHLDLRDRLFRVASGEWVLLIADRSGVDVAALAEALRKEVSSQLFKTTRFEASLSASVVAYPLAGDEPLMRVLDESVFEARRSANQGGNRVVVLGSKARSEQEEKEGQRQAARIRRAIEDKRLKLAYQSIASLEGDAQQYFDVFVRMIDETGQERLAREFLPMAEKYGLMRLIDRWVTSRCLSVLAKRAETRDRACLFVHLSQDTLRDAEGFLGWFREQTRSRPLQPDELVFELQEPVLQNHIRKAKLLSGGLAGLKVDMAIDYFGTSANSVPLLEHVPVRFIKFHPSFTQQFANPDKQKRLRELLEVARQRGAKAIVSHVEDANVMARLWQMGVNLLQGNSLQEPEVVLLSADVHVGRGPNAAA